MGIIKTTIRNRSVVNAIRNVVRSYDLLLFRNGNTPTPTTDTTAELGKAVLGKMVLGTK